jgi:predicted transcriptional regulator
MNREVSLVRPSELQNRLVPRSRLPPREREIADLVYCRAEVTATQVCASTGLGNSAVRSMLRRLVAKGVIARRRDGKKDCYFPAIVEDRLHETLLQRIADDHFDGSLRQTALKILQMLESRQSGSTHDLAGRLASFVLDGEHPMPRRDFASGATRSLGAGRAIRMRDG